MASTSSLSSSADQNPWFSVRRAFRNLQQQRFSGTHRKKPLSEKKAPETNAGRMDPFRSNDQISGAVSSGPETIDPVAIETSVECPLCMKFLPNESFLSLLTCQHRSCINCLKIYLRIEITEGRVSVACPECPEKLHPADICRILEDDLLMQKYEDFMLRHVLVLDPDARWCPAPDCGYAVIATGHASCPKLECARPGCGTLFCYHCKQNWHPDQTCDSARAERSAVHVPPYPDPSKERGSQSAIKACPRCGSLIMKLEDGSCNHMTCAGCGAEFCWLCLREISDLHYLSPSGCTFWGKKPWSHKRKILWQLGMLVGAPVGISLIAGVAFPVIIIGLPILVARKLLAKCRHMAKRKRHLVVASGVIASTLVSPVLAALAVGVGVPMLLAYVYGVVPVSLCRDSCCTGRSQKKRASPVLEFDLKDVPSVSTVNIQHGSSSSSSPAAAAAAASCSADDVFACSPSSISPGSLLPVSSMSKIEVQAEVSHDLARHEELSHQMKRNSKSELDCATPALSSASSTLAKNEVQGISVDRDLNKNCLDAVSFSNASLNASLPEAACLFSATTVADCTGTCNSDESVRPRLLLPHSSNKAFAVSAHGPPCGSTAFHVKSFKRQSMSVGDSIDERVEAEHGYLSLHSLAEEEVCLESFAGGSDIVTMVAVSEEMPDMHCKMRPAKCLTTEPKANLNELKKLPDASSIAESEPRTVNELNSSDLKEASLECDVSPEIHRIKECDKHL